MKNAFILFAFILIASSTFAQTAEKKAINLPNIDELEKTMTQGNHNAFVINLDGIPKKDAEKEWKDFTKSIKAKSKQDRKTKLWLSDDAEISSISNNTVDMYADVRYESSTVSSVYVWFDLGGAYLSSATHSEEGVAAKKMLQNFTVSVYQNQAKDVLKQEENTLSDFEKDLKKLEKNNKEYHKKIEEAKELIAKMEKNIEVNIIDQEKKTGEITTQKETVKSASEYVKDFDKLKM